jgi:hypothetical protein
MPDKNDKPQEKSLPASKSLHNIPHQEKIPPMPKVITPKIPEK